MSVEPSQILQLQEPFQPNDIKWRVLRADIDYDDKPFVDVCPYISKRAMQQRLDDVLGPENWCNTSLQVSHVGGNDYSMQVGISINIAGTWVTKFDVSQCTDIEPVKGGFSTAAKRAACQWGVGRYLDHLGIFKIFLSKQKPSKDGVYCYMKKNSQSYWWIKPILPGWTMPTIQTGAADSDKPVTADDRKTLYLQWKKLFAPNEMNKAVALQSFYDWVFKTTTTFPIGDLKCWTHGILNECRDMLARTKDPSGPTPDVTFE